MAIVTLKRFKKSELLGRPSHKGVKTYFTVDLDAKGNGSRKRILNTEEEIKFFSKVLGRSIEELTNPNSEYWRDYQFIMEGGTAELDDSNPEHQLNIKVISQDSRVISSDEDRVKKPKAEYILERATEVTEKKVSNRQVKADAFSKYALMSEDDFKDMLLIYGKNPRDLTSSRIKEIVGDEMEKNPQRFLDLVDDKNFDEKVFINDLVQEQLIRKSGTSYIYDGEMIAHDNISMLAFVKDPKNQNNVIAFKKQLNEKKGSKKHDV